MTRMRRLLANLFGGWFQVRRHFPPALLDDMAQAVAAGEHHHMGEVRFAIEPRLAPLAVLDGLDARERARQVFSQLRIWDTEHNSGVLFYVLMAEHRIEIVADRGIARRVTQAEWDAICARIREHFAAGRWREGSLHGIAAAHALLTKHFPAGGRSNPGELPDQPMLL